MAKRVSNLKDLLMYYNDQNRVRLLDRQKNERPLWYELGLVLLVYLVAFVVILIVLSYLG